jgi:hypothetical protein
LLRKFICHFNLLDIGTPRYLFQRQRRFNKAPAALPADARPAASTDCALGDSRAIDKDQWSANWARQETAATDKSIEWGETMMACKSWLQGNNAIMLDWLGGRKSSA